MKVRQDFDTTTHICADDGAWLCKLCLDDAADEHVTACLRRLGWRRCEPWHKVGTGVEARLCAIPQRERDDAEAQEDTA